MTREDIVEFTRQAGGFDATPEFLERFAKLVRDDYSNKHANLWLDRCHAFMRTEREECAKVADLVALEIDDTNGTATYIAAAIRARGNT